MFKRIHNSTDNAATGVQPVLNNLFVLPIYINRRLSNDRFCFF